VFIAEINGDFLSELFFQIYNADSADQSMVCTICTALKPMYISGFAQWRLQPTAAFAAVKFKALL